MSRVLVGMSGGVDSSVAALLLKQAGYEVAGAYIRTWSNEYDAFGDCPASEDIEYSSQVCRQLGIDFEVVNLVDAYHGKVVQYLVDGYRRGFTPNPDIMCNREIKFGVFLDYARSEGFDTVATGHYCRNTFHLGKAAIAEGIDANKDQSYFLALVTPDQVQSIRFPIGDLTKTEVREMARANGFSNASRKDSQGICFLGKVSINEFLRSYIPDSPGSIVNLDGKVLGEHRGLHHFTIGQRKGIGIPSNTDHKAYVVVAKDLDANTLVVAFDEPTTRCLFHNSVKVHSVSYTVVPFLAEEKWPAQCRVRYRDPRIAIKRVSKCDDGSWIVHFSEPQRALAPGQVLAFYEGPVLLGGGIMVPKNSQ